MEDRRSSASSSPPGGSRVHPIHRRAMRHATLAVAALTVGVFVVWAMLRSPAASTVRGYLALHMLLETTSIVVAMQVFSVGWAAHRRGMPGNILVLACAFLGVGALDFSHMVSFVGMPDFVTANTPDKAISFWLAARVLAAVTLLAVSVTPWRPSASPALRPVALGAALALLAVIHWLVLGHPAALPALFVAGRGVTRYKLAVDAALVALHVAAAVVLCRRMRRAQPFNAPALFGAVCVMALTEVFFTFFTQLTDVVALIGHVYKVISYFFLYRAIFVDAVEYPYERLRASEGQLKATLDAMPGLVFELDLDGRCLDYHSLHDAGVPGLARSVLGRTARELLPPDVADAALAAVAEAHEHGYSRAHQVEVTLDADRRWFEFSVSRKPASPEADPRFIVLARDITDRKRDEVKLDLLTRRAEAMLGLPAAAEALDDPSFLQYGIELAEQLTNSRVSRLHFVVDEEATPEPGAWYADALRTGRPVVRNDPAEADPGDPPPDDPPLDRVIAVPVLEAGRVRMVAGVGNGPRRYTDLDVETVRLVANDLWRLAQQRRAEASLRASENKLTAILDGVEAHIFIKDREYRYQYANQQVCSMFGHDLADIVGRDDAALLSAESAARMRESDRRVIERGERVATEEEVVVAGQPSRFFYSVKIPMYASDGTIEALCGVSTDITERKRMEGTLRMLSLAVEQSPNSIVITDLEARIEYANAAFVSATGYSLEEVVGLNPRLLQSGKTPRETYADMWSELLAGRVWRGELINRRKDGGEYVESALISPVRQGDGRITNYLAVKENITEKKAAEERIERLAHFDHLTGLPNRATLIDRFRYTLSVARRRGENVAVMFLDLDHFKDINDTLGHSVGDQLLMEVARRLKDTVREQDTVSRLGGDEFVVVLPGTDAPGAAHVGTRLLAAVSQPCAIPPHELITTSSIGIAIYPDDGDDFETLSKNADAAMYRVKQGSRNGLRFFTPEMQEHSARTLRLANALRHAMERDELSLHYQPQLAVADGALVGAEALLRWRHPELGPVSPGEFIPIAEDSGQIIQIGEWVLRTAMAQLKRWMDDGLPPMVIAVNLSAAQFRHANLPALVTSVLADAGVEPARLELELTEAVAMDDAQAAIAVMDALDAHGIRMSIDDFGTGYSSLTYLKRFKVYKLKIDQSFVRTLSDSPEDQAIVRAIIQLASSLGMRTIAEGVETGGQLAFLRANGCDEVQGYHLSRPLATEAFEAFVRARMSAGPLAALGGLGAGMADG